MIKEKFKQKLSSTSLGKDITQLGSSIVSCNYIKAVYTVIKSKKLRNLLIFATVTIILFSAIPILALSGAMYSAIMEHPMEDFKPEQIQEFKNEANAWEHTIQWLAGYDKKGRPIWRTGLTQVQIQQVDEEGVNLSYGLIAALKEFGIKDTAQAAKDLSPTSIEFEKVEKVTRVYEVKAGEAKLISTQKSEHYVMTKIVTYNGVHTFSLQGFTTVTDDVVSAGHAFGTGEGFVLGNPNEKTIIRTVVSDTKIGGTSWSKDYSQLYKVEKPIGITKNDEDQKLLFRQAFFYDPMISDPYALNSLPEFSLSGSNAGFSGNFEGKFYSIEYDVTQNSGVTEKQINEFLAYTPMHDEGQYFIQAGKKYGVDPAFMVGIAGAEQSFRPYNHNAFGMTDEGDMGKAGGFAVYSSDQVGIFDATRNIAESPYYVKAGKKTIKEIWKVWAPDQAKNDPQGLNQNWARNVVQYMNQLKSQPS